MCTTTSPAKLSKTILLAHYIIRDNKMLNITGYKNTAVSEGASAMLIGLPSASPMSAENCINLGACPGIFDSYAELVVPSDRSFSFDSLDEREVLVFDSGSYRVLLARRASLFTEVLDQVPEEKRPAANPELYAAMDEMYPDFWFALCCWKGSVDAEPLLWWYEPLPAYVDYHFLPGTDAHTGKAPNFDEMVDVDTTLVIYFPTDDPWPNAVDVRNTAPEELRVFLPNSVDGVKIERQMPNGDWVIPKRGFTAQDFNRRVLPPGLQAATG